MSKKQNHSLDKPRARIMFALVESLIRQKLNIDRNVTIEGHFNLGDINFYISSFGDYKNISYKNIKLNYFEHDKEGEKEDEFELTTNSKEPFYKINEQIQELINLTI